MDMNMGKNTNASKYRSKYTIGLPTVGLFFIISLSFLLNLFTRLFSGYAYAVLLVISTAVFIFFKHTVIRRGNRLVRVWMLSTIVIILSFLNSQRSNGALLDVIVFVCGLLLIFFCSIKDTIYLQCVSVIKAFAIFFASGIFLQTLVPPIYRVVLMLFPSTYRTVLLSSGGSGFTFNNGYSAGYIIAGIIATTSGLNLMKRIRMKDVVLLIFLLMALLLTGKRGPTMFLVFTIIYCYLVTSKGSQKVRRYLKIFLAILVGIMILWVFRDALSSIPIIGRTLDSIAGLLAGKDITSGRTRLYLWALELFKRNPVFGIGWGRFRTTVVGNATLATEFEAHNIYLQLLAETGIIGCGAFVTTFLVFWNTTRIAYCECVKQNKVISIGWRQLLLFSFAYQTYFLLYGLTGNPLFDPHFQIMYVFSCMIIAGYKGLKDQLRLK